MIKVTAILIYGSGINATKICGCLESPDSWIGKLVTVTCDKSTIEQLKSLGHHKLSTHNQI